MLEKEINECSNIIYYPHTLDEETLNYYIERSDIILMPYRHASMSGLVFKAAEFDKTLLTTSVGSIPEYIDSNCAYLVDSLEQFGTKLNEIIKRATREELKYKGRNLGAWIRNSCSWDEIAKETLEDVYSI